MTDDKTLRQDIIDELEFDPTIDAEHIGVAVEGGVVTLSGHVPNYAQKVAAERATEGVKGVKAIAMEIEVRYPFERSTADDQIAKRAADALAWNLVPPDSVQVTVEKGWVKLSGKVDWHYQKTAAESAVTKLGGVRGVSNVIEVKPRAEPTDVKRKIVAALHRSAQLEANNIQVSVTGGKVRLDGKVKAWSERRLVERAAWAAPGVTQVEDNLKVE
jgi:osmotically-inducible protein OsmY